VPIWVGAGASLTTILSGVSYSTANSTNPAGNTVLAVFGSYFQDNNPAVVVGVAVVGFAGNGTWQFSINGGATWKNIPAVSTTAALPLSASDKIRFVPKTTAGGTATLQALAWDGSTGTPGTTANPKLATSAFSATTLTATALANRAPTLTATTLTATAITEGAISAAVPVSSLLTQAGYSDPDGKGLPQGIAIVAVAGTAATVQYLLIGGTWQTLPSVTSSAAILLPSTASLRFVAGSQVGTVALTFEGWDQTQGALGHAFDITSTGGATAFSAASTMLSMAVNAATSHAPTLTKPALTEPAVARHATGAAIAVSTLLTQAGYADAGGGNVPSGVAISGTVAAGGTWEYMLAGGSWRVLPSVSSSSALLLPSTAFLRLIGGSQVGTATLTFAGWDQTQGTAGQLFDSTSTGGGSAFSTASTTVSIAV
jgi:trimeric autotransporter adhesin